MALTPEEAVIALAAQMIGASTSEENLELEALEKIPLFIEYKEKINLAELLEKMKQGETTRENCINGLKSASKDTQLDALGFAWIAMLADGKIDASEIELIEEVVRPLGLEAEEVSDRSIEINATAAGGINERIRRGTGETETTEEAIPVGIIVDKEPSLIGTIFYFIKSIVISAIIMFIIAFVSVELLEIIDKPLNEMEQVAFFSLTLVLAIFWFRNGLKSKKENRAQQIKDKEIRDKEVSEKERIDAERKEKERKEVRKRGERREQERKDGKRRYDEFKERKENFYKDNGLTIMKNGNLRDSDYQEYEKGEVSDDYIEYKPEGIRGQRAFIKTAVSEFENEIEYLAWSGPIDLKDKAAFLRGDFKKAKEESPPIEEAPTQEQEVENIEAEVEAEQENKSETGDDTMSLSERLNKLTELYDEGKLTKEELQNKTAELMS